MENDTRSLGEMVAFALAFIGVVLGVAGIVTSTISAAVVGAVFLALAITFFRLHEL
jgi:hypothetical protein